MQVIYEGVGLSRERDLTWRERLFLLKGKLRRAYLLYFRPAYVEASLKRRVGSCDRTGACCHLMFSCPMLKWSEQTPSCRIYSHRMKNCTTFPIDERDLEDRDIISPSEPCGFSFRSKEDNSEPEVNERKAETVLHE